jgi:hypothetical protein
MKSFEELKAEKQKDPNYQELKKAIAEMIKNPPILMEENMPKNSYEPTSDPFTNSKNLKENVINMEVNLQSINPVNRTLVLVYGSSESPSDFKERANRLVAGLNMPDTIKAVVMTVNGDKVFSGLDFTKPQHSGNLDPDILDHVKKRFVQVLEVNNGGAL